MEVITEPFQKAVKRQKTFAIEAHNYIDEMISNLQALSPQNEYKTNAKHLETIKKTSLKLTDSAKDYQGALGKCSKGIEKKFKTDLDSVWDPKALEGKVPYISIYNRMKLCIAFYYDTLFVRAGSIWLHYSLKRPDCHWTKSFQNNFLKCFTFPKLCAKMMQISP
jgi:hypothetical protein